MDRLLTRKVPVKSGGQSKQVSVAEAIVRQLMKKAASGNPRAWRALLKYQEFASRHSDRKPELIFVESEYTQAVAKATRGGKESGGDNDRV